MIKYFSLKQEKKAEADAAAAAGPDGAVRPAKKTKAAHIRVQKGTESAPSALAAKAPEPLLTGGGREPPALATPPQTFPSSACPKTSRSTFPTPTTSSTFR